MLVTIRYRTYQHDPYIISDAVNAYAIHGKCLAAVVTDWKMKPGHFWQPRLVKRGNGPGHIWQVSWSQVYIAIALSRTAQFLRHS